MCVMGDENTEAACSDGCDNNGDNFIDCMDFDCAGIGSCPAMGVESNNLMCQDGLDNNNNGSIDCEDFDCEELSACTREQSNKLCSDGADSDGDMMTDCDDPDCDAEGIVVCDNGTPTGVPMNMWTMLANAECSNDVSDDANMFIDCGDFACLGNPEVTFCKDLPSENTNAACSNGMDDDEDGQIDCADNRCRREGIVVCNGMTPTGEMAPFTMAANAQCSDGINNDMFQMFTDCDPADAFQDDFGCTMNPDVTVCPEANDAECSDGIDNGNDSGMEIDCEDFACSHKPSITVCMHELSYADCTDGMDNDGNGRVDCDDFSCSSPNGQDTNPACL
jgi:hypothetical protein